MAASSCVATPSSSLKFSPLPSPRPPETTTRALPSSGPWFVARASLTKVERSLSTTVSSAWTWALPPEPTASKALVRTVMTLSGAPLRTVAMAPPA